MNAISEVDVVILSYAQTDQLKRVTVNAIHSLIKSEDPNKIKFKIVVIESKKDMAPFQYDHTITIYPEEEFNFHQYLNLGINLTSSPYICLCNNDLLFQKGWAGEILSAFRQNPHVSSASPVCPYYPFQINTLPVNEVWIGYRPGIEIQGACLFLKREILGKVRQLDPNFKFYSADLDYADTLRVLDIKHMLVRSAVVFHLESRTLLNQDAERQYHLMKEQDIHYKKKWFHRTGRNWVEI